MADLVGYIWRFEAVNFPGYYIRQQDSLARVDEFQSTDQYNLESSWRVVKGLCGSGISFLSMNSTNKYLRHASQNVRIDEYENTDQFREEASFILRKGLANDQKYSFEPFKMRGYFVRHSIFLLRIDTLTTTDLFKNDATFGPKFVGY